MAIIDLLRELRGTRSQQEWADELGVSQDAISDWFQGARIGKPGLLRLLDRYPEHRDRLLEEVFAAEGFSRADEQPAERSA